MRPSRLIPATRDRWTLGADMLCECARFPRIRINERWVCHCLPKIVPDSMCGLHMPRAWTASTVWTRSSPYCVSSMSPWRMVVKRKKRIDAMLPRCENKNTRKCVIAEAASDMPECLSAPCGRASIRCTEPFSNTTAACAGSNPVSFRALSYFVYDERIIWGLSD
eukprot:IDg2959t1